MTGLPASHCQRLVDDILAAYDETLERFIQRRHLELKAEGLKNAAIYAQLIEEASGRRFVAPALSARQVRRMIYG